MSETKICYRCGGDPKPVSEFGWNDKEHTRRDSWCRNCRDEVLREKRRARRAEIGPPPQPDLVARAEAEAKRIICEGCGKPKFPKAFPEWQVTSKTLCLVCDRKRREAELDAAGVVRVCPKCGPKPASAFYNLNGKYCKECRKESSKKRFYDNHESELERAARYYEDHREEQKLGSRDYASNNRAQRYVSKRRRDTQALLNFIETVDDDIVYKRDEARCWLCGEHIPREQYCGDHIIPLIGKDARVSWPPPFSGPQAYFNIRAAHDDCNTKRGGRYPSLEDTRRVRALEAVWRSDYFALHGELPQPLPDWFTPRP